VGAGATGGPRTVSRNPPGISGLSPRANGPASRAATGLTLRMGLSKLEWVSGPSGMGSPAAAGPGVRDDRGLWRFADYGREPAGGHWQAQECCRFELYHPEYAASQFEGCRSVPGRSGLWAADRVILNPRDGSVRFRAATALRASVRPSAGGGTRWATECTCTCRCSTATDAILFTDGNRPCGADRPR